MHRSLPALPLGDRNALRAKGLNELIEMVATGLPSGWQASDGSGPEQCLAKFNSLNVKGTTLCAFSMVGSSRYHAGRTPAAVLSVTFSGEFSYKNARKTLVESGGRVATLTAADEPFDGELHPDSSPLVGLAFSPDPTRLSDTLRIMSGPKGEVGYCDAWLGKSRELPLQFGESNLFISFAQLIRLIHVVEDQPTMLAHLSLDDGLYRHAALMLRPDIFFNDQEPVCGSVRRLDDVCDFMLTRLDKPVSLTELESISGLSARALQYAFRKRFGCSPLQWLVGARLDQARMKLLKPEVNTSVTSVALDAGFLNPSSFSKKYFERFGELPSRTLTGRR
jgi:AraC-like DNA-binding protein